MTDFKASGHDFWPNGEQGPQLKGEGQYELPNRLIRQDIVNQVGCCLGHSSSSTAGAESTEFAGKCHEIFFVALFTLNS